MPEIRFYLTNPSLSVKYMMDGGIRQKASARHTSVSSYIFRKRQTSVRQSFDEVPLGGLMQEVLKKDRKCG